VSSPSSSTLGRRVSAASSFSRGPAGHGSSGVLSCNDTGESYFIIIKIFCYGGWRLSVPIYDARNETNFLDMLSDCDRMDRYNRDLPSGSVAAVGYTVNTWGTPVNVSFNVKWVMLLGLPH